MKSFNTKLCKAFGIKVRKARRYQYLSQEDLADMVGLARTTIQHIESGEHDTSLSSAIKIAQMLSISLDDIAGGFE